MKPEIEAKFLHVEHAVLRAQLQALDAVQTSPMRLMKRKNYDFPDGRLMVKRGWARVRDEGDKITLSYKELHNRELDGTHEVQVVVDDFAAADALLRNLGLVATSYQETKRESWKLDGCEIELDEWPWAKPYVEIEGLDEKQLRAVAAKLHLDWQEVLHGSVEIVYRGDYDVTDEEVNKIPVITFNEPIPDWLQKRKRS
ncbi:MAG TPA: CYTH domain-containing protein [Patescibacteria group bacterium]|nr:CYTH domain-containing protein [Patescibacteria group bacterium]